MFIYQKVITENKEKLAKSFEQAQKWLEEQYMLDKVYEKPGEYAGYIRIFDGRMYRLTSLGPYETELAITRSVPRIG